MRPLFKAYFPVLFNSTSRTTGYSNGDPSKPGAHTRNKSNVAALALEELGRRPRRGEHEELGSRGSSQEEILSFYGFMRTKNAGIWTGMKDGAMQKGYGGA
jgi:hypothetical protein